MKNKGIAIVLALATVLVVSGIGALIFTRTIREIRHGAQDQGIVQTLMLARGAANLGGSLLATRGRERLERIVQQTASSTDRWAYGGNTGTEAPDPVLVAQALANVADRFKSDLDGFLCGKNFAPDGLPAEVRVRVYVASSACGEPLPPKTRLPPGRFVEGAPRTGTGSGVSQTYALPFVMVAEASLGQARRNIVLQGEYRFTIGRSSFARYALFTNLFTNIWFTDRTLFDGPVHTNGHFRFYRSPWFGGEVTSAGCLSPGSQSCQGQTVPGAYFYGEGFVRDRNMRPSAARPSYRNRYGTHAPEFTAGVDWNASFIPLPPNSQDQRTAAQKSGLYFGSSITSLKLYRKCLLGETEVACSEPLDPGVLKLQYIEVTYCVKTNKGKCPTNEVYRYGPDGLLYQENNRGLFVPVLRNGAPVRFNGVIYTDGEVRSLSGPKRSRDTDPATAPPALAEFAQITVAAQRDIRITGDLKYEKPPCTGVPTREPDGTVTPAVCDNLGVQNVLGVYSQEGSVWIAREAPRDIHIHGTLMSSRGVVGVEDYDSIPEKGSVYLLGGIIEYYSGVFGTLGSVTGRRTGYGQAFTYDRRFLQGLAPPFFPTTGQDRVTSVSVFSYGQREQVY